MATRTMPKASPLSDCWSGAMGLKKPRGARGEKRFAANPARLERDAGKYADWPVVRFTQICGDRDEPPDCVQRGVPT